MNAKAVLLFILKKSPLNPGWVSFDQKGFSQDVYSSIKVKAEVGQQKEKTKVG